MASAALWDGSWIYCILASALLRILPWSFPPLLPCSRPSSLNPSSGCFLPPAVHASSRPFLACSLHQPSLLQPSLPLLTLSACLASSLHPFLPLLSHSFPLALPPLCSLHPHNPVAPSLLPPSLPPSIHPSLPPSISHLVPSLLTSTLPGKSFLPRSLPGPSLPAYISPSNSLYTSRRCFSGALKQPPALFQRGAVAFSERPHESFFDE